MSTSTFKESESLAADARFDKDKMPVRLRDGREISVPLRWFAKLKAATT